MENGTEPAIVAPTPEEVLGWIAAHRGEAWFPSRHAQSTGTPRDLLDSPLNELRSAGLIRVVDWVRGVGQGYALSPSEETTPAARPPALPPPANEEPAERRTVRPLLLAPLLAAANLLVYFVGLVIALRHGVGFSTFLTDGDGPTLFQTGAVTGSSLIQGEWWRLASSCFVHGTFLHLLVNAISLLMIGWIAEQIWGRWRTMVLYLVSGFAGSCLAMAVEPMSTLVGASGAIYGIFASIYAWLVLNHRLLEPEAVVGVVRRLAPALVLSIAVNFLPRVSWEAHLGGALAGFAVAILLNVIQVASGWRRVAATALVAVMPAACLLGLLLAIRNDPSLAPFRTDRVADVKPDPAYGFEPPIVRTPSRL